jgi:hypothetical protein
MTKLVYCAQPGRLSNRKREVMNFVLKQGYALYILSKPFFIICSKGEKIGREKTWNFVVSEGTLQDLTYALKIKKPVKVFLDFDPEWEVYYRKLKEKYKNLREFF